MTKLSYNRLWNEQRNLWPRSRAEAPEQRTAMQPGSFRSPWLGVVRSEDTIRNESSKKLDDWPARMFGLSVWSFYNNSPNRVERNYALIPIGRGINRRVVGYVVVTR